MKKIVMVKEGVRYRYSGTICYQGPGDSYNTSASQICTEVHTNFPYM